MFFEDHEAHKLENDLFIGVENSRGYAKLRAEETQGSGETQLGSSFGGTFFTRPLQTSGSIFAQSLVRAFFFRTLWLTLLVSLLLALVIPGMLYIQNLSQYKQESFRLLNNFMENKLVHTSVGYMTDSKLMDSVTREIEGFLGFSDFVEFKIWTTQNEVLYSFAEPEVEGQVFQNHHLDNLYATGEIEIEVEDPDDVENAYMASLGQLIEMYVPIRIDGRIVGAVEVYRKAPHLDLFNIHILGILAVSLIFIALLYVFLYGQFRSAARTISAEEENLNHAYRSLGFSYLNTVRSLIKALELKDMDTEGHSERAVALAIVIAEKYGLPKEDMDKLVLGAYLHDIGKIGIPDYILLKPGRLTLDERKIVETHVIKGKEIIQNISFLNPAVEVVLYHHEKWDGTGYPEGLKGKEIPLTARIFGFVDVLEALLSDRPYKDALPFSEAKSIILTHLRAHFDPEILEVFKNLEENHLQEIARDIHKRGIPQQVSVAVENLLEDFIRQQSA